MTEESDLTHDIAVIGIAARVPGAGSVDQFWDNLVKGVESITFFSDDELRDARVAPEVAADASYVKAAGILDGVDLFDGSFFGYSPREADLMDPQQRLFMECCYAALDDAGRASTAERERVGVFAGATRSSYQPYLKALSTDQPAEEDPRLSLGNERDFLTTRVSYKLDLHGPSLCIQTGCSSSLVAIHLACQSLLYHESDLALAGGVSASAEQVRGAFYHPEGIVSPDGHCRVFDAQAQGTVRGNGVGVVVLKRLPDALAAGDHVRAVIKASAVNNDGSAKVGFTAPSVEGQSEVIVEAIGAAGISAETVTYIEAHGTGTLVGDPIEVSALTRAFRFDTDRRRFCALGSVKSNIGHLDAAAGVAGLIKTVLALEHQLLPPTLHVKQPNPLIEWEQSPFYVNATLREWEADDAPRRAGVSSFGVGGTNAHVILEEAPRQKRTLPTASHQLVTVSAQSAEALDQATADLRDHLASHPSVHLADVAYTLQTGRRAFLWRRAAVCRTTDDARAALDDPRRVRSRSLAAERYAVGFLFSGQGSQYAGVGAELYRGQPVFRECVDYCCDVLRAMIETDLRELLLRRDGGAEEANQRLTETEIAQPALFVLEYALASLWREWGITPGMMLGHSIGEYTAACLAGVFSLEDALKLVAVRGKLMQAQPRGAMLAVALPENQLSPMIEDAIALAAVNAADQCVLAGPEDAIERLLARLAGRGIACRRLRTSHAFHSWMMEPVVAPFAAAVAAVQLHAPSVPFVSNLTGEWITAPQATDPEYWAQHLRRTVAFDSGVATLRAKSPSVLLEVGPGHSLTALVNRGQDQGGDPWAFATMPANASAESEYASVLSVLGELWVRDIQPNWERVHHGQNPKRVPLPSYPFQRQRHRVERSGNVRPHSGVPTRKTDVSDWLYAPVWKRTLPVQLLSAEAPPAGLGRCLVLAEETGVGLRIVQRLRREGHEVIHISPGVQRSVVDPARIVLRPDEAEDYCALFEGLRARNLLPDTIVHAWALIAGNAQSPVERFQSSQSHGFYSIVYLMQALHRLHLVDPVHLFVLTQNIQRVTGDEVLDPYHATVLGPCRVIAQEHPNIDCRTIDIALPPSDDRAESRLLDRLLREFGWRGPNRTIAYRGDQRWVPGYERIPDAAQDRLVTPVRPGGVYLITGGWGNIGLVWAEYLAQTPGTKLVLVSRSAVARDQWVDWVASRPEQGRAVETIRRLQDLEARGAEILVLQADVGDREHVLSVVESVLSRFGQINGVVHAAGVVDAGVPSMIDELVEAHCEEQFRAKVFGTIWLAEALQDRPLDFCVMQSSLSTVLGGVGLGAYAAANAFLDAYVLAHNEQSDTPWMTVDWDGWKFAVEPETTHGDGLSSPFYINPSEGRETIPRLLAVDGVDQLVISTGDLADRLRTWVARMPRQAAPATTQGVQMPATTGREERSRDGDWIQLELLDIWKNLLGLAAIGPEDNFFQLGGDSLVAIQLVAQIQERFGITLSLRQLLDGPTVVQIAESISRQIRGQVDEDKLSTILTELENLSEAEVERLLGADDLSMEPGHGDS